jgi:ATP-binding cassette subfamily C protein
MRLMFYFFRAYPRHTLLMLLALLLSGLAEGVGLSALLPLLNIALGQGQAAAVSGIPAAAGSDLEQHVLAALAYLGISPTLGNMLLIVMAGILLKSVFLLLAQRQVGYTAAQVGTDLRLSMLRAVLRSRWEYFLHQPAGKLTNALATEAERASASFVHGATATTFLIHALIYGGVAFALSWRASLTAIAAGVIVITLSHFLVRLTRKAGRRQTQLMSSLVANLTDTLQSVKAMKAMAREQHSDAVLATDTGRLNKALRRQVISAALLDSMQELMFAGFICLGVYVALVVAEMELATVMVLVVALGRAFSYLGKVQKQYQKLAQGESALWAMLESIEQAQAAEEASSGGSDARFGEAIRFDHVSFSYDTRPVFDDLSLVVEAGSLTTLVGPSGAGKTTFIDLVIGLLHPRSGTITIDGRPLEQIALPAWRSTIGYVPQDTVLLHASILHNVTLGDPRITRVDVEQALRAAGAWPFVASLPEGMDTMVGERGGKLSGGQRQRVVIARALINKPQLLILDEATSALDSETEEIVRQTMEGLKGQLTILSISHNRAMVQAADVVYQLGDGGARLLDAEARSALA